MVISDVEVPTSFVKENGFLFNDVGGAGQSVFFPESALADLYKVMGMPNPLETLVPLTLKAK